MIDMGVVSAAAQYAEEVLSKEGFRHVSAVVANCKMLVAEIEGQGEEYSNIDLNALILAGYLHDISTAAQGFHDHHVKSAEMSVEFLRELDAPAELISKVEQAILTHASPLPAEQKESIPLESRILYDADKLGRLSGLAIITSLIELGSRFPNRAVTGEVLAAILRHIEERFVELYQSLNTAPAREMAKTKFGNTLAFLDGVIEHLTDATPV
jgi:HD superfamily phosphodiesterase